MERKVFLTRLVESGEMRRVTIEYFYDKGFSPEEIRRLEHLYVGEIWPNQQSDHSVRRIE